MINKWSWGGKCLRAGGVFYGLVVLFGISHGFANGEAITGSIKAYLFVLATAGKSLLAS